MRAGFITKELQCHSIYARVREELEFCGVETEMLIVERALFRMSDLQPRADLYVLRTRTYAGLSVATALSLAGARLLVPLEREAVVRNRFLVQRTLAAAGIPTPRSYMASAIEQLAPLLRARGPLILKPFDTGQGKSVHVVRSESELPHKLASPIFVQELVEHAPADIKLYGIGSNVFAIRRRFPALTIEEKEGEPFAPTGEMIDIAAHIREAFGLELYGADLLETGNGLVVVDVNSTPGYKGVAGAAEAIAELICSRI